MASRAEQRAATRERIVEAAVEAFADEGFHAASTRAIAARAGTNQGLITYHFRSKDELWRAAADRIFGLLHAHLAGHLAAPAPSDDPRERAREAIRAYVRFAAAHPELFRFMVEQGKHDDDRMQWLVDNHLAPMYEAFGRIAGFGNGLDPAILPHLYYVVAGASSLVFAAAPECQRLTGLDPGSDRAVETHADLVARLLVS